MLSKAWQRSPAMKTPEISTEADAAPQPLHRTAAIRLSLAPQCMTASPRIANAHGTAHEHAQTNGFFEGHAIDPDHIKRTRHRAEAGRTSSTHIGLASERS